MSFLHFIGGLATVFGLGFVYFISAIPTGAALQLPIWLTAIAAWLGYSCGGLVVVLAGAPLREKLMQKLKIQPNPDQPSLILRAWKRFGLPALGLLAPVTIGPQVSALLGVALGAHKGRLVLAIALGAIPWTIAFAVMVSYGVKLVK